MIRLTWRQFRVQAMTVFAPLAVLAVVLAVTGPHLVHLYDTTVAHCATHGDCSSVSASFLANDRGLQIGLDALVVAIPALIGLFWGAPLVAREIEAGTYRLAWTQSVSRARWLAVKVAVVGLASVGAVGLLSLMVTWWSSPVDLANINAANASVFVSFDQRALVPVGYGAFAFALALACGVLFRRTLPAMATTLAAFVLVRLAVRQWVRPNLFAPHVQDLPLDPMSMGYGSYNGAPATLLPSPPNIPNAWIYSTQVVDKSGHALTAQNVARACPGLGSSLGGPPASGALAGTGGHAGVSRHVPAPADAQQMLQQCVTRLSATFHEVVRYQPGSRYWPLQVSETAIFVGVALALVGLCFWWVRHRLS